MHMDSKLDKSKIDKMKKMQEKMNAKVEYFKHASQIVIRESQINCEWRKIVF